MNYLFNRLFLLICWPYCTWIKPKSLWLLFITVLHTPFCLRGESRLLTHILIEVTGLLGIWELVFQVTVGLWQMRIYHWWLSRVPVKARWLFLWVQRESSGDCRGFVLFFLALCRTQNCDTWEFKGRGLQIPSGNWGNDKLAFLSNNTKHLKCLSIKGVGEIRNCPCYVFI